MLQEFLQWVEYNLKKFFLKIGFTGTFSRESKEKSGEMFNLHLYRLARDNK